MAKKKKVEELDDNDDYLPTLKVKINELVKEVNELKE